MKEFLKKLFKEDNLPNWLKDEELKPVPMKDIHWSSLVDIGFECVRYRVYRKEISNPLACGRSLFLVYYGVDASRKEPTYELYIGESKSIYNITFICELETLQQLDMFYKAIEGESLLKN